MAANYDEEVTIPVRFVEEPGSIQELKDAADELNAYVRKYEKSNSKRGKNSYVVPGATENLQLIDNIISEISKLSEQWNKIDMTNPFTELEKVIDDIAELERELVSTDKERASTQSLLGNNSKQLKRDEKELLGIKQKEIELQEEYDAKIKAAEADTSKGSNARLKNLQAEYNAKRAELSSEKAMAETKINLDNKAIESNRRALRQSKFSIATTKEELAQLKEKRMSLEELSKQEGYEEKFAQRQKKAEQEIEEKVSQRYKLLLQIIQATRDLVLEDEEQLNAEQKVNQEKEKGIDLEKEQAAINKAKIHDYEAQISRIKQSTAQYYYQLRSVKMLGFALTSMNNKMTAFGKTAVKTSASVLRNYLKLTNIFTTFGGLVKKVTGSFRSMNKQMKATNKQIKSLNAGHKEINLSLKEMIKNILKYGLGIRSVFVLFNKLRNAMIKGFENMAPQFDRVNRQLSSVITSFNQMRNAIAGAVQPLLNILAPALEKISALLSDVAYKVASFIAALTGQKTVYKAIKYQLDYADSLDKTKKKAKEAKKELSGLDKLNVLTSDKNDDNDDNSVAKMFEEVPIDKTMSEWAKKFKDFFKRLFAPIKAAWDKEGDFVMKSWQKALKAIKSLIGAIGEDFWKVWEEPKTQEIFENIFHTIGDIGLIVANLATNFEKAWRANNNGYRILASIRDIIWEITKGIRDAADYTVIWSGRLDFEPLLTAVADVLTKQIVPAVHNIVQLLVWVYEHIFLELLKHFIEKTLPTLVRAFGNIAEAIGAIAGNILKALNRGNVGLSLVHHIENIVDILADTIYDISEYTKDWAKSLDFYPLIESIRNALAQSEQPIQNMCNLLKDIYKNVILPLAKYIIEVTLPNAIKILANIVETVGNIAKNISDAFNNTEHGQRILDSIRTIAETIGNTIVTISEKTKEWAANLNFEPLLSAIAGWLESCEAPIQFITDTFSTFYNNVLLPFWQYIVEEGLPKLLSKLQEINNSIDWDALTTKVNEFLAAFEPFLEKVWDTLVIILGDLGEAIANFVNSEEFGKIVDKLIEWMNNADPEEMAKGIEKLVKWFIELKAVLALFSKVVIPLVTTVMTFGNVFMQFRKDAQIAQLVKDIGILKTALTNTAPTIATVGANAATAGTQLPGFLGALQGIAIQANTMITTGALGKISPMIANIIGVLQPIAGIAAVAVGAFKSLSSGASMLAKGFNLADEASMLLGIALTAIGAILLGAPAAVTAAIAGIVAAVSTFIIALGTYGDTMLQTVTTKFGEIKKAVGKWFENAGKNLGKKIGELISSAIKAFQEFPTKFKEWSDTVDWAEFGLNILKGILAIFLAPVRLLQLIVEAIASFFKGFVEGLQEGFDMHSPSKKMEPYGENILKGLLEGIVLALKGIGKWINDKVIQPILKPIKDKFDVKTLVKTGTNLITGLWNGIKTTFSKVKSDVNKKIQDIIKGFRDKLKPNTLTSVGRQLINGLKSGLTSALGSALSAVSSLCNKITAKAKQAFQVKSPSKVFMEIGEYLTKGLVIGMEEDADETDDAMEELMPSLKSVQQFADKVTNIFARMSRDSVSIVRSMIDELNHSFDNLSKAGAIEKMINRASQISMNTRTPKIAEGYQLPSNKEFLQSMEKFTESNKTNIEALKNSLPDIMKQAFIDAITETADLQTDDETIIVSIDGRNIFQAVRSENAKFIKQHGVSAFA